MVNYTFITLFGVRTVLWDNSVSLHEWENVNNDDEQNHLYTSAPLCDTSGQKYSKIKSPISSGRLRGGGGWGKKEERLKIEGWIILSQRAEVSELGGKKKRRGPVEPSWEGERFGNPPSLLLSSHHSVSSPSAEGRQLPWVYIFICKVIKYRWRLRLCLSSPWTESDDMLREV